jgi:hypothetical protein
VPEAVGRAEVRHDIPVVAQIGLHREEIAARFVDLRRGRVIVDAISQDGYTVTFSLRNLSNKWMTEETSCFLYTCTDAEGNVLVLNDKYYGTLYIGMLEANDVDTYTITLPEGTVKLEFGDSRIVYWSQWA